MRKIYDCFTFFNEYDLLDIRLEEHYDHVDHFVIVESNKSFQNKDKEFNLEKNWDRYAKYHDKIIYIKVEDMPGGDNPWVREAFQRNAIARGIIDASDNDVIIVSDCDEMLRASTFDQIRNDPQHYFWICRQPIFWVKLNYWQSTPRGYNISSMAITKEKFMGAQHLRDQCHWALQAVPEVHNDPEMIVIHHAGWHFTYFGDTNQAKIKLLNFSHAECSYLAENIDVESPIVQGLNPIDPRDPSRFTAVTVDEYFPQAILNNLDRWKDSIVADAQLSISELLPSYEQT